MNKITYLVFLLTVSSSLLLAQEKSGIITGTVLDITTQQPLVGATIQVLNSPKAGAVTDLEGLFKIKIPVGEYSVKTNFIGYKPAITTNIVVSTGRPVNLKIQLTEEAVEMGGMEVTADYFDKGKTTNTVSTIGLQTEEIRRSPGSAQDMQRIVHILPGVANSNDQNNELLVRGGAPNENLTVMDHIEIPSTNHYPNDFNSGGPINMVNVDLIEDLTFSTGGFSAHYGDKLSSVMDIKLREGDRTRLFATNTGFNMAGLSTVMEGKLGGKGSWLLSLRNSLLEVADKILGLSTIGLSAVPKYWDGQFKVVYDVSQNQKMQVSGIYGNDKILFEGESDEVRAEKAGITDSVGINRVDFRSEQFAGGMSLKSLWGNSGYTVLTLSAIGNKYFTDVASVYSQRSFDAAGKVTNTSAINRRAIFHEETWHGEFGAKLDGVFRLTNSQELNAGVAIRWNLPFESDVRWDADTTRFDFNRDGVFEVPQFIRDGGYVDFNIATARHTKSYLYLSDKITAIPRFLFNVGLRYDYFSYSEKGNLSPRLSASFQLFPSMTTLNVSYGEYHQTQSYPLYVDPKNTDLNRYMDNSHARHLVFGVEHLFGDGLKASVEVYSKQYDKLPISEEFVHFDEKTYRSDKLLNIGEGYARGVEFFLQKKLVDDYYGTFSYSFSTSRTKDPRINRTSEYYDSPYDYPHILTMVFGKLVKDARAWFDAAPWWIRYPSMILPITDDMEFSFRWRYASGRPYTPKVFNPYEQHREGGVRWTVGSWNNSDRINSERYPDYHRLDLLWLSRWHLTDWNIVLYLSIQNVYGRKNVAAYQYNDDGTRDTVYQWGFFPIGGLQIEF